MSDAINPAHYKGAHGIKGECIEYSRQMSYAWGCAFKYVWRAGKKGDAAQDLAKALWYLEDAGKHEQPTRGQVTLIVDGAGPMTRRRYVLGCIARGDLYKASVLVRDLAEHPEHIDKELT